MSSGSSQGCTPKYGLGIVPRRQHSQHMLDRQTTTSDDRLASENPRTDADSLQKLVFIHCRLAFQGDVLDSHSRTKMVEASTADQGFAAEAYTGRDRRLISLEMQCPGLPSDLPSSRARTTPLRRSLYGERDDGRYPGAGVSYGPHAFCGTADPMR